VNDEAAAPLPVIEWEAREGFVTVYDHEGHYLGCMGTPAWDAVLQAPREVVAPLPSPSRLAEIRARAEAATPGPWRFMGHERHNRGELVSESGANVLFGLHCNDSTAELIGDREEQDTAFIAHAREDIPYLLAAMAEAQERIEAWKEAHDSLAVVKVIPTAENHDRYRVAYERARALLAPVEEKPNG
jgi:hypothetical protein